MPDDDIYFEPPSEQPIEQKAPRMGFRQKIIEIQHRLKAPKNQWNGFGKYAFRSCEDILEGLKPLLHEYGVLMTVTDSIVFIEGRFYLKATVTATDAETGESIESVAYAREPENRKGSDQSQVTGSTSSYARKYAMNALWLIDDTKDADADGQAKKPKEPPVGQDFVAHCEGCGTRYTFNDRDYYLQFIQNPGCCQSPKWVVD